MTFLIDTVGYLKLNIDEEMISARGAEQIKGSDEASA